MKVIINATGYGQVLLDDSSTVPNAQGAWFLVTGVPVESKAPATKAFQSALARYAHYTGVPDFTWYEGWGGADLMIRGLGAGRKESNPECLHRGPARGHGLQRKRAVRSRELVTR